MIICYNERLNHALKLKMRLDCIVLLVIANSSQLTYNN